MSVKRVIAALKALVVLLLVWQFALFCVETYVLQLLERELEDMNREVGKQLDKANWDKYFGMPLAGPSGYFASRSRECNHPHAMGPVRYCAAEVFFIQPGEDDPVWVWAVMKRFPEYYLLKTPIWIIRIKIDSNTYRRKQWIWLVVFGGVSISMIFLGYKRSKNPIVGSHEPCL